MATEKIEAVITWSVDINSFRQAYQEIIKDMNKYLDPALTKKLKLQIDKAKTLQDVKNVGTSIDNTLSKVKKNVPIELTADQEALRKSLGSAEKLARDTKVKLDQDLKLKLETNVANFQQTLTRVRQELKVATWPRKIELQIEANRLQRWLTEAKRNLNNFVNNWTTTLSRLQAKFDNIWKWIIDSFKSLLWPLAIIGLLTRAVRWLFNEFNLSSEAAINFEKSMSNVATLVDTSVESMSAMSEQLLNIAERVPVSINELTSALYDVRSAGISAENAMSVLEQSAILATAGLGTTKEAANLLTSAINTFWEDTLSAEDAATTFFLAVKNGKTTISELANWFGSVASLAQSLWVDFNDLIASVTALTTSWLSASEAYTQVSGILSAVAKAWGQSSKMAKQLWFDFSATALASKGLEWFINDLWVALENNWIEGAKTTEVLAKLFGRKEAIVWVLSLLNSRSEQYASILAEMNSQSSETNKLLEAYSKQTQTAEARVQRLNNQLEVQRIALGQTTSKRRWFGIYLKIEFYKTIRSIWNTFWLLADLFVGSLKIMYKGRTTFRSWVWTSLKSFFTTWKFNLKDSFNFSWVEKEVNDLLWKVKKRFDWSAEETAQAVKTRNDAVEELNNQLKDNYEDTIWKSSETVDWLKDSFKEAISSIESDIDKSKKSIDDYTKSIEDLNKQINDLNESRTSDIAKRVVEIDKRLQEIKDNQTTWTLTADELKEQKKLQEERLQAFEIFKKETEDNPIKVFQWLSDEDKKEVLDQLNEIKKKSRKDPADIFKDLLSDKQVEELKAKIEEVTDYEWLTDIWKIQEDYENKKTVLEQELADKQDALDKEQQAYAQLQEAKKQLDADYTAKFNEQINQQKAGIDSLIQKYKELAIAKARAGQSWWTTGTIEARADWWPVTAWSSYIVWEVWPELFIPKSNWTIIPNKSISNTANVNVNANVSNWVDINVLADQLARKIKLSQKGIL